MMMKSKRFKPGVGLLLWILIIVVLAAAGVLIVKLAGREEPVPEAAGERPESVRVERAETRDVIETVALPATIEARHDLLLAAETSGRITEMNVDKGDRVKAGDVLMRIDAALWQALIRKAEVQLRDAERDLKRYAELEQSGAVSQRDFDDIQLRRDTAAAELERAQVELDRCTLKVPIDGVVNDRMLELGEYANEGAAVIELVDISRVKLRVQVPEANIIQAAQAEEMEFGVDIYPGRTFSGRVAFVASKAGARGNSFPVELICDNADGALKAGMIATVRLPGEVRRDALVLPISAVISAEGEYIVYVARNERAERRVVKLDAILEREVLVAEGVAPGEDVVVEGQRVLGDGRLISIAE
jgi:membrane fusion protein, multidrug efflux system